MFTFNPKARNPPASMKSVDTGFVDGWYTSTEDRPNASVVGGMTVSQAYAYVAWVYGAVGKISEAVRSYPLGLYRGEDEIWDDPALASITKDLRENLAYSAECVLLAGAAYWLPTSERADGKDIKFEPLPLLTVTPKNNNAGDLLGFEYAYGGKKTEYKPEELIYFWKKSLTKRNQPGVSAAMVALGPASQLFAIDSFIASYFNRGAVPVTVWPVDPATPKEEQERFQNWLNRSMSGVAQAFRNIVIRTRPDVKAQTIGSNVKDTQAPELVTIARDNVAVAFNIPPSILSGANGDESNQRADYAAFYQFCVTPLIDMLCQTLNEQFLSAIGLELWPETDRLPIMGQQFLDKATALIALTGAPVLTVNEAREMLDLEPMAEAEEAAPPPATMPTAPAPMAPQAPEDDDMGEDMPAAKISDVREAMAQWRDRALSEVHGSYIAGTTSLKLATIAPYLFNKISDGLGECKTAGDIRAVFERHWPHAKPVSDITRLARALEDATKALHESETGV